MEVAALIFSVIAIAISVLALIYMINLTVTINRAFRITWRTFEEGREE